MCFFNNFSSLFMIFIITKASWDPNMFQSKNIHSSDWTLCLQEKVLVPSLKRQWTEAGIKELVLFQSLNTRISCFGCKIMQLLFWLLHLKYYDFPHLLLSCDTRSFSFHFCFLLSHILTISCYMFAVPFVHQLPFCLLPSPSMETSCTNIMV